MLRIFDGVICPIVMNDQVMCTQVYMNTMQEELTWHHGGRSLLDLEDLASGYLAQHRASYFVRWKERFACMQELDGGELGRRAVIAPLQLQLTTGLFTHLCRRPKRATETNTHAFTPEYRRIAEAEANWLKAAAEKKDQ